MYQYYWSGGLISRWTDKKIDELLNNVNDSDGWRRCVIVASEMIPPTMPASRDYKLKVSI